MLNWNEVKEEYVAGGTSYRKLAAAHGVSHAMIGKVAAREGWVEMRKQREALECGLLPKENSEEDLSGIQSVSAIADKLIARLSELVDIMVLDTQGVKQIVSALKDLRDLKEYPTDADLRRARIRKLEREAEGCDDGLREVEIVFKAGSEAWKE